MQRTLSYCYFPNNLVIWQCTATFLIDHTSAHSVWVGREQGERCGHDDGPRELPARPGVHFLTQAPSDDAAETAARSAKVRRTVVHQDVREELRQIGHRRQKVRIELDFSQINF